PVPGRFKDYIAMPKSNMYQSLHTTIIGTMGHSVEIQIRTWEMHRVSEYGVAAHWRYKEGNKGGDKDFDQKVGWLRQVLEWQDASNPKELVNALKLDVFSGEVFVFTPRGDVLKLPKGAVPLDFAYRIHTDVGHHCVGAKVNGKIVSLDYTLQNGDIVDIITSKTGKPSLDWLNIVGSTESRSKIRNWFKKENKEENIVKGRELLEKEAKRLNYEWKELNKPGRMEQIAKALNAGSETELLSAVGYGGIPVNSVLLRFVDLYKRDLAKEDNRRDTMALLEKLKTPERVHRKSSTGILVNGEPDVMVRMARCCNPVPGDEVVGYITRGRGVSVHRADCPNIGHTPEDVDRMIEVSWDAGTSENFHVAIEITAYDRGGLLMEIMATLSEMKINIVNINAKVDDTKNANINLVIEIRDVSELDFVMTKVRRIRDVYTVQRANGGS
ncbi:RelA/SpoT family protein, partial [Veillonella seminalis]|uniref:RelA/SpoT family protein n=1 Tax=Veillonella seminalis TaxID=1502943 RepID=UPI0023F6DCFD